MDDMTFERDVLARLAAQTAYPPTPPMRARVLTAIAGESPAHVKPRPSLVPRLAVVAAAAAVIASAIALAVPSSRSAIADFFGVEGVKIERLPTPAPGTTATPLPPPSDLPVSARPASLDEATQALDLELALPEGAGDPEAVYLVTYGAENVAILRFADFDVWQARPRSRISFGKGLPPDVTPLDLTVNGHDAYFIQGAHTARVFDENNAVIPGSERTVARSVLIFSTGRAFYRIETDLPEAQILPIAQSLP